MDLERGCLWENEHFFIRLKAARRAGSAANTKGWCCCTPESERRWGQWAGSSVRCAPLGLTVIRSDTVRTEWMFGGQ